MCGMTTRRWFLALFFIGTPVVSSAADSSCSLEVNEENVLGVLETAATVEVSGHQVPVPTDVKGLEFKVSEGRGQFVFRLGEKGSASESERKLKDYKSWGGLSSILFTDDVKVGEESEVFVVSHDCVLGDISISFIGMKKLDGSATESDIVLLRFQGGASVLLFGDAFDAYLEALRRMNVSVADDK